MENFEENCFPIIKENFLKEFGFKVDIIKNEEYIVGDSESLEKLSEELKVPYFIIMEAQNYKDTSFWAATNYNEENNDVSLMAFNKGIEVEKGVVLLKVEEDYIESDPEQDNLMKRFNEFSNKIAIFYVSQLTFLTSWVKSTINLHKNVLDATYKLNRPTLILKYIKDNLDVKDDFNIELKVALTTRTKYLQVSHKVYGELNYLIWYTNEPKERISLDIVRVLDDTNTELYFEFGEKCTIDNNNEISEGTISELKLILVDLEETLLEEVRQHKFSLKSIKIAKFLGAIKRFFSVKKHRK